MSRTSADPELNICLTLQFIMTNLLWLLHIVFSVSCVNSQISFSQSGPGTVRPGEDLTLTCKVTGASLTDSTNMYGVCLIRQSAGKGLEWLGAIYYNANSDSTATMKGRLTITRDTNKGEVYFKLTEVKPEDTCVYYCTSHAQQNTSNGCMYMIYYNRNILIHSSKRLTIFIDIL
uniref:Ig-like domain-containing protein n=1 Tax=Leptobrachium leishanense TaxID=445787 RepID=A0A8C5M452_9ANUR